MDFDINAAQSDLIKEIFRRGDPQDRWYRYISYAAVADLFTSFRNARRDIEPQEVEALRTRLIISLQEAESSYPPDESDSDPIPLYLQNSLSTPASTPEGTARAEDRSTDQETSQSQRRWLPNAISMAVGASFVLLCAWLLQQFGAIYVVTSQQPVEQFARFDRSLEQTRGAVADAMQALQLTEATLTRAMADRTEAIPTDALSHFVRVETVFPDFYKSIQAKIPKLGSLIMRLSPDGRGYKILMQSELCGAVAFQDPAKVDSGRDPYGYLCRSFGLWNKAGRDL